MPFHVKFQDVVRTHEPSTAGDYKPKLYRDAGDYYEFLDHGTLKVFDESENQTRFYAAGTWIYVETLDGQEPGPPPGIH